jgi:hypothetical protein
MNDTNNTETAKTNETKTRKVDVVGYDDGTWSLREHGADCDIEEGGESLSFATDGEARQHANDSGWEIVHHDS